MGAVSSRSCPSRNCNPTLMATSARRSSLTGSIEAERLRSCTVMTGPRVSPYLNPAAWDAIVNASHARVLSDHKRGEGNAESAALLVGDDGRLQSAPMRDTRVGPRDICG